MTRNQPTTATDCEPTLSDTMESAVGDVASVSLLTERAPDQEEDVMIPIEDSDSDSRRIQDLLSADLPDLTDTLSQCHDQLNDLLDSDFEPLPSSVGDKLLSTYKEFTLRYTGQITSILSSLISIGTDSLLSLSTFISLLAVIILIPYSLVSLSDTLFYRCLEVYEEAPNCFFACSISLRVGIRLFGAVVSFLVGKLKWRKGVGLDWGVVICMVSFVSLVSSSIVESIGVWSLYLSFVWLVVAGSVLILDWVL